MEDIKRDHTLSEEAVKVFRKYSPYLESSRIPLLLAKRPYMKGEDMIRCDRTVRALKHKRFF
jgi:hypothetical protein